MSHHKKHLTNLLKGAGFSLTSLFLGIFLGLVLSPYTVKSLGDHLYGIMILAGTFTGWFSILDLGLASAVERFITFNYAQKNWKKINEISISAFLIYAFLGSLGLLGTIIISALALIFWPDMKNVSAFSAVIVIFGLSFLVNFPLQAINGVISGVMRPDIKETRNLFFRILGALCTFLILYFGQKYEILWFDGKYHLLSKSMLLVLISLSNLIIIIINIIVMIRIAHRIIPEYKFAPKFFNRSAVKLLFGYSIFTFIINIADKLVTSMDSIIIASFISISVVTHYNMVATIPCSYFQGLMLACMSWMTSWLTLLHGNKDKKLILQSIQFGYKFNMILASYCAFGLIFWGQMFITRWLGSEYLDAYPALVILTIIFWLGQCQSIIVRYLFAIAKHHYFAYMHIIDGIINLILSLILVQYYGILGVALGTAIPGIISRGIVVPIIAAKVLGLQLLDYYLFLLKSIAGIIIALVLPFLITKYFIVSTYMSIFMVGAMSALVYFPMASLFVFNRKEYDRVLEIMTSGLHIARPSVKSTA